MPELEEYATQPPSTGAKQPDAQADVAALYG
jgi:hypothetical protein